MNKNETPVFIINRDLLDWPKAMVADIRRMGGIPIIVDTGTSFSQTFDWYESDKDLDVFWCGRHNYGHKTPWLAHIISQVMSDSTHYVVTDPDLDLSGCPSDTIDHLIALREKHTGITKAGLSLEILDYPSDSPVCHQARMWEEPYWLNPIDDECYSALVDTTFAVYKRSDVFDVNSADFLRAVRANRPYTMRHLPFYLTQNNFPRDVWYYLKHANPNVSTMARYLGTLIGHFDGVYSHSQ